MTEFNRIRNKSAVLESLNTSHLSKENSFNTPKKSNDQAKPFRFVERSDSPVVKELGHKAIK